MAFTCRLFYVAVFLVCSGHCVSRKESSGSARENSVDGGRGVWDEEFLTLKRNPAATEALARDQSQTEASGDHVLPLEEDNTLPEAKADDPGYSNVTSRILFTNCSDWLPINHIYFQLANTFLLLSYLTPPGIYGLIYLRATLAVGSALFSLWGWTVLCAFDTFLWNAIFVTINLAHAVVLVYSLRPVRFDKQVEEVYECMFKPLKVSKQQFKKVVGCIKTIRPLKRGEHFAKEQQTKVETLSLILSGRLAVSQEGKNLHILTSLQFVDSPEWFGVSSDDYFQVTIEALEDCRLMQWHRDKLKLTLLSDAFLQSIFDHVLGRDVVRKLTQVEERLPDQDPGSSLSEKPVKYSSSKSLVHEHAVPEQMLLLNDSVPKVDISASRCSLHSRHSRHSAYDLSKMDDLNSTDI